MEKHAQAILPWLSPLDFLAKQNAAFEAYTEGTGQWFLDSPGFENWCTGDRKSMFSPGIRKCYLLSAPVVSSGGEVHSYDSPLGGSGGSANFRGSAGAGKTVIA